MELQNVRFSETYASHIWHNDMENTAFALLERVFGQPTNPVLQYNGASEDFPGYGSITRFGTFHIAARTLHEARLAVVALLKQAGKDTSRIWKYTDTYAA